MMMNFNEKTWKELVKKFSSYEGTVTNYCKESNISKSQFYYYKKKLTKASTPLFHAIEVKPEVSPFTKTKSDTKENMTIKVELGRANIYLPSENLDLLSAVIKEISKLC
jgi:ribosome-associated translation inhibitor RaiA